MVVAKADIPCDTGHVARRSDRTAAYAYRHSCTYPIDCERTVLFFMRITTLAGSPGTNPRQYLGDWGPSSPLWRTRPGIATELMPRTLPGTFWMDEDAFLEVFNTLYAVDLGTDTPRDSAVRGINSRVSATEDKRAAVCKRATAQHAASDPQEGRCGGSWGGENCGGR